MWVVSVGERGRLSRRADGELEVLSYSVVAATETAATD